MLAVSIASAKCAKPHWWNSGGATSTFSRPRSGIEERIATAAPMPGEPREAPFGVPVVPEVRIVWRPSRLRRHGRARVAPLDQLLERGSSLSSCSSSAHATKPRRRYSASLRQLGELRVVDDRARLLALDHLGQLRAGERGVEQHRVGAELGERDQRLDDPAVVAAHHGHAVALQHALVRERVGEPVRALVDLGEGERAALVDHRLGVRVQRGGRRVAAGGRGAPAPEGGQRARRAVGPHGAHEPGAGEHVRGRQALADQVDPEASRSSGRSPPASSVIAPGKYPNAPAPHPAA